MSSQLLAHACLVVGFVLAVIGIALWSVPLALVVAGVVLFVSGGLELRRTAPQTRSGAA